MAYISAENPAAARRLKDRFDTTLLPVAAHPYLYPVGRIAGTHEIVAHPNYVIVYRATKERIEVVSVLHARQLYPRAYNSTAEMISLASSVVPHSEQAP